MFFCVSQSTSSINKVEGAVSQTNDTWYQETGKFWRFWTSWFFTVISIMALGVNKRKETCSLHASGLHTSAIEPIEWEVKAIVENFSKPPCYGVTVRCFARLLASGCLINSLQEPSAPEVTSTILVSLKPIKRRPCWYPKPVLFSLVYAFICHDKFA